MRRSGKRQVVLNGKPVERTNANIAKATKAADKAKADAAKKDNPNQEN